MRDQLRNIRIGLAALILGMVSLLAPSSIAKPISDDSAMSDSFSPYVDAQGNISFPHDFEKWAHLGSWMVHAEGEGESAMHIVYTPQDVIDAYRMTGEFPDGAPMVKDVRKAPNSAHTTGNAYWASDVIVRFVMIKDTVGRYKDNPLWGDGWGWALFKGNDTKNQAATDYKVDCLACHEPVRENDLIYTYAYPVLGLEAMKYTPKMESVMPESMSSEPEEGMVDMATLELGAKVFKRCKACHSLDPGKNGLGPSLANLKDRKSGSLEGFNYSKAMKASDVVWTADTLDSHLKNVKGFIKGNRMGFMFPAGIPKEDERKAVVAYLMSQ